MIAGAPRFVSLWPRLQLALEAPDPVAKLVDEICPGVFVFDALERSYCKELLLAIEKFDSVEPNTMNKYGVVLRDVGLGHVCQYLMDAVVTPLTRRFYPRIQPFRSYHGFSVAYAPSKQRSLAPHYDQSAVTLNVCLGRKFTGGRLMFRDEEAHILAKHDHEVGQAVLHLGTQLHQAQNIKTGQRTNLILWCRTEPAAPMRAAP